MIPVPFFDLGSQVRSFGADIHSVIDEVLLSGYFVGGPLLEQFENEFAAYIGVPHCIGVGNGLDALRLALESRSIGPGDEVIVPAFTFYATILSVIQTGATAVPVDVDAATANMDPSAIESAITARTKAIVPVHLYGQAAEMRSISEIAHAHGLDMFEDAAQSHGAMSDAGMTGSVGVAGAFSFYPTKNLGALGDAGAVTTSDDEVAARIRSRRSYGQGSSKYDHVDTGWNSRLDPIQAAILSMQLPNLERWNATRQAIAETYLAALGDRGSAVVGPRNVRDSVWHHFVLRAASRSTLRRFLADHGVATDVHYPYAAYALAPVQLSLSDAGRASRFPRADTLAAQVVSLPIGPWMSAAQVTVVSGALELIPRELLAE